LRKKRKARVSKDRQVNTYAELWEASWAFLKSAEKKAPGFYYQTMGSLTFSAFTMEAYLNHLGKSMFRCCPEIERALSPAQKLWLLAEKVGVTIHKDKPPFQTVFRLLQFRNDIAHGKTVFLKKEEEIRILDNKLDEYMHRPLQTKWQKYCQPRNAKRARGDVEKVIRLLHDNSGAEDDLLFNIGMWGGSSVLVPEEDGS